MHQEPTDDSFWAEWRKQKEREATEHSAAARAHPDFRTPREELIDRYELESGETYRPNKRYLPE